MLWWALACHAKADDYSYNVSAPVYTKLTDQLQRLKREHKPLRLKVNSHTGVGKTYFIRHHDANYRGCRLLDFDDFEGANRSSALLLAYDACAVLLGSAHLDKHSSLDDVAYVFVVPSLKDIRHNVAKRNEGMSKHHERWSNETYILRKREQTLGKVFPGGRQRFPGFDSFEIAVLFCAEAYGV